MIKTRIISAFTATGKSYLFDNGFDDADILDADCSEFRFLGDERTINPDFPENYIEYIKSKVGRFDYILVSSRKDVRNALEDADLCWCLVAPDKSLMLEWVGRCYVRGSSESFINGLIYNWDELIDSLDSPMPNGSAVLSSGEYLKDKMFFIRTLNYN